MKASLFFVLLAYPILVNCFYTEFGPYDISQRTVIYRAVYMYGLKDAPKTNPDGHSRLSISISTSNPEGTVAKGSVITAFMTKKAFDHLGYKNQTGQKVPCCDEYGYNTGACTERNALVIDKVFGSQTSVKTSQIKPNAVITDAYDVTESGMYYVVAAVCDPTVTLHTRIEGNMIAENPYGHLPATQYSSLPFYSWMSLVYVVALIVWGMLCIQYSKEIMSVHIIILIVLLFFVINYLVKVLYLWIYNSTGSDSMVYIAMVLDVITRSLTRVLTILVCMGLGVSRANITDITCKLVFFAISYFLVNLWDSYIGLQPSVDETISKIRVYVTAGMDAFIYFWVFQSLMDTMETMKQNKQNAKLSIFMKLYTLLLVSVIVSTLTLLLFSYLIRREDLVDTIWKYQWFMNEGIWCIYYFILFICLMVMWRPSENAAAYAYHSELATDAHEGDEEYGLPQNKLVESDEEGDVVVNPVTSDMKPMNITEGATQA